MKTITITENDYNELSNEAKKLFDEFLKVSDLSEKLTIDEFFSEICLKATNSEKWVFRSRLKNITKHNGNKYKKNDLLKIYNSNKDLRSQSQILIDFEVLNHYCIWNYFKIHRNTSLTLKQGLKYAKKINAFAVDAYGNKKVYPISELQKLK